MEDATERVQIGIYAGSSYVCEEHAERLILESHAKASQLNVTRTPLKKERR